MSKTCKKRVHGNGKKNLPWDSEKCPGSLHFTLMNFVTSHSSWEASKIKSPKTNRWIIELLNSLLSNINDGGHNNEKTKKLKTRVGMFKNMGWNIPGGNFPGGSLMGGNFSGWEFSWYRSLPLQCKRIFSFSKN